MPTVVFFTDLVPELAQRILTPLPPDYRVQIHPANLPDEAKTALVAQADFLILFPGRLSEPVLRAAPRLQLIQLVSAGYDALDLDLCARYGVPVANNGGTNAIDVAEHTVMFILSAYRRLREMDRSVRAGAWDALNSGLTTFALHGKTVGIVGLGQIGRQLARVLAGFGVRLLYTDTYPATPEVEQALGVVRVDLDTLLQQADIVTLHVALTEQTRGLIGQRELALMRPTALLVNTCRGPVIDEPALLEALRDRRILGAALDVLTQEPPEPANPLLALDNLLLTPHTAGVTYDTWPRRGEFIARNLQRVWAGQPPIAAVSRTAP